MLQIYEIFGIIVSTIAIGHYIYSKNVKESDTPNTELAKNAYTSAIDRKQLSKEQKQAYVDQIVAEIHIGRDRLIKGEFHSAAVHFAKATVWSQRRKCLLHMLENTMPDYAFDLLLNRLMRKAPPDVQIIAMNALLRRSVAKAKEPLESEV